MSHFLIVATCCILALFAGMALVIGLVLFALASSEWLSARLSGNAQNREWISRRHYGAGLLRWRDERQAACDHGCLTGDCPHVHQEECYQAMAEHYNEYLKKGIDL